MKEILALIGENEIEQAIDLLKKNYADRPIFSEIILLESRWNALQTQQRQGTISFDEAAIEQAKIRKSLIEITQNPTVVPPTPAAVSKLLDWKVVLAFFGTFALLVVYLTQCPQKMPSKSVVQNVDNQSVTTQSGLKNEGARMLNFAPENFKIRASYIGEMEGTLEKVTVESSNSSEKKLTFYFKLMFPFGSSLQLNPLFLTYENEKIVPSFVENTFFKAGETGRAKAEFLIPSNVSNCRLEFVYGTNDNPPKMHVFAINLK